MSIYSAEMRNAVAAAIANLLGGSSLYLLSETGRTLAVLTMPSFSSDSPGEITAGPFERASVMASGEPTRYEIRKSSGQVLLSGAGAELKINPPSLLEGGLVYVDGFTLTV